MEEHDYLEKAKKQAREGKVKEALTTLNQAVASNADSWTYLIC